MSVSVMRAVPCLLALTILPLATCTIASEGRMSLDKSDKCGVMWAEQPESINH